MPCTGGLMKPLKISEDIVPLGEFKAKATSIIKALPGRRNPLVITQNGRPACVVMSPMEFDRMREREAFLDALLENDGHAVIWYPLFNCAHTLAFRPSS